MTTALRSAARQAARVLQDADALLITAGAGIGVDSGLPDFRGTEGLWKEYPPLKHLKLDFADMANPAWFEKDPCFAWGFYGHRLLLYRRTVPHSGFAILRSWAEGASQGHFVFTSNVDGQFQRAGFADDRVVECHGSIHFLQGTNGGPTMSAEDVALPDIDPASLRINERDLPRMPDGSLARPNILMFGDWGWDSSRTDRQRKQLTAWLKGLRQKEARVVVVEMGAGEAVPTVRRTSEALAREFKGSLVRINPRESHVPAHSSVTGIPMACGAAEGLSLIDAERRALKTA
eukprot:TRINITY_DN32274_c0_g1_i1.p1 TRINITY_DN32274_c0_g1~~TRINITY_DN32274_c0_g1_i1.p1  ORF type:complete len:301 (+),score=48.24 TRINITY_DN32274_c0_g1_i1:35-904(+)